MMRPTLTRHLLAWALGALALVWCSFIALGYQTGQHEADELTDGHLASTAALLLSYGLAEFGPRAPAGPPAGAQELKAHDYQQSMSVVVWNAAGTVLTRTGVAPVPAFGPEEGFATLQLGQPAQAWRVFSRWDAGRTRKVMVLLSERERDELADDIAEQIAEPGLWLLPVIALALGLAIRRGLRPLYQLSRDVHALDIHSAQPLEARSRHEELRATALAINTLMERYHAAITRERELASEFAHEMRTPLAAVSLHARALAGTPAGPEQQGLLLRLDHEVQRAGQVLTDLLSLARASRAELDDAARPLEVGELVREVMAAFAPAAHESGHELSLACAQPFTITGHPVLLALAARNLVENALSHTPAGTQVEVQVDAGQRWLQVCDRPGPATAREARPAGGALGLGLGLRVVEKIAALHGARIEQREEPGWRRCYRLQFAAHGAPAAS